MITRGIIEARIDPYHAKVRIPTIDKVAAASIHTATKDLTTAILSTIPGLEVELVPGDVVIVAIDPTEPEGIILGYLYRDSSRSKLATQLNLESLAVRDFATLPKNTTIGNLSSSELQNLAGSRENIQKQIDDIKMLLDSLRG